MAEESQAPYSDEDKLQWEVKKLQAETTSLKRPWISNPVSWIAMVTSAAALAGVFIQYAKSDREYKLSQINLEENVLKTAEVENSRQILLAQVKQITDESSQAEKKRDQALSDLNSLLSYANELQQKLPSEAANIKDTTQRISNSIQNLQQASDRAKETESSLQVLSTSITENNSAPLAFAVVGSFPQREKALDGAKKLKERGLAYPVEVYQREPNRYALTLGGYLDYQEASRRVEYAKQQGMSDAYARLAKNWGVQQIVDVSSGNVFHTIIGPAMLERNRSARRCWTRARLFLKLIVFS
jgi:myosin heavy subunit